MAESGRAKMELERIFYHVCISGFRQRLGAWNGAIQTQENLIRDGHQLGLESRVDYYTWNAPWCDVANYMWSLRRRYDVPIVVIVHAYSWGAGWGAMQLARKLGARGMSVRVMVLCEPIHRHPNPLLRWRTLDVPFLPRPVIRIPDNVDEVYCFTQSMSWPSAHRLIPESENTVIHEAEQLHATHVHMHLQSEWLRKCREVSCEVVGLGRLVDTTADAIGGDKESRS